MEPILAGSRAFFDGLDGFRPHDTDWVHIVEPGEVGYEWKNFVRRGQECHYYIVRHGKEELLAWSVAHENPMSLCHYMLADFAREFGLQVGDLEALRVHRERLVGKHSYLRLVYDFILQNGEFSLTDAQRGAAFEEYKLYK